MLGALLHGKLGAALHNMMVGCHIAPGIQHEAAAGPRFGEHLHNCGIHLAVQVTVAERRGGLDALGKASQSAK